MKRFIIYTSIFGVGLLVFYLVLFQVTDFNKPKLVVIKNSVENFSFLNQNGDTFNNASTQGKVYVAEYFFTSCTNICPVMNANLRRVYDVYKDEPKFLIASHTCLPETDTVPLLKKYERKTTLGLLTLNNKVYKLEPNPDSSLPITNKNWFFLTGNKEKLYKLACGSYVIDNPNAPLDTTKPFTDQFIHTQHVAVVDKYGRVRKIYNALSNNEVDELIKDIKELLTERPPNNKNFTGGVKTTPN